MSEWRWYSWDTLYSTWLAKRRSLWNCCIGGDSCHLPASNLVQSDLGPLFCFAFEVVTRPCLPSGYFFQDCQVDSLVVLRTDQLLLPAPLSGRRTEPTWSMKPITDSGCDAGTDSDSDYGGDCDYRPDDDFYKTHDHVATPVYLGWRPCRQGPDGTTTQLLRVVATDAHNWNCYCYHFRNRIQSKRVTSFSSVCYRH
jgi:hypothetical protein